MNFSIGNHERSLAEIMKELQDKAAELVLIGMFKKNLIHHPGADMSYEAFNGFFFVFRNCRRCEILRSPIA